MCAEACAVAGARIEAEADDEAFACSGATFALRKTTTLEVGWSTR